MPALRTPFRSQMREAAVTLLADYAEDRAIKLQVYPGRPRSIMPPTAFVDRFTERVVYIGPTQMQRTPVCEVIVLHGLFDSKDAVDQADAFVDGFLDWQTDRVHSAGTNTEIAAVTVEDDPEFTPTWQPPEVQRTYYATRISLEGLALD